MLMIEPLLLLHHGGRHAFDTQKRADQVDAEHFFKFAFPGIDQRPKQHYPGVVDQDVDPAPSAFGLRHQAPPTFLVGHVMMAVVGGVAKFSGELFTFAIEHVRDDDLRSFRRKNLGGCRAHPARAAGYDCNLVCQFSHFADPRFPRNCLNLQPQRHQAYRLDSPSPSGAPSNVTFRRGNRDLARSK